MKTATVIKVLSFALGLTCLVGSQQVLAISLESRSSGLTVKLSLRGDTVVAGPNLAKVTVLDSQGKSVVNAKVTLYYGMRAMDGMPPMNFKARLKPEGSEYVSPIDLKMRGRWDMRIKVKASNGKSETAEIGVTVK